MADYEGSSPVSDNSYAGSVPTEKKKTPDVSSEPEDPGKNWPGVYKAIPRTIAEVGGIGKDMLNNAKQGVQSVKDLANGNYEVPFGNKRLPSPNTDALADKLFPAGSQTGTTADNIGDFLYNAKNNANVTDVSKSLLEKFGNNPAGKAVQAIGGLNPVYNATGTVINRDVNPTLQKVTGMSPENLELAELLEGARAGKSLGKVDPTVPLVKSGIKGVGDVYEGTFNKNTGPSRPPITVKNLFDRADMVYSDAEKAGGALSSKWVDNFVDSAAELKPQTREGKIISAKDTPLDKVIERAAGLKGQPMSLKGAQEVDKYLSEEVSKEFKDGALTSDGKKLLELQNKFRDAIKNSKESDNLGGKQGFQKWKDAQKIWHEAAKARDIELVIEKSSTATNPAASRRAGFRALYNSPSRMRGMTAEQRAFVKKQLEGNIAKDTAKGLVNKYIPGNHDFLNSGSNIMPDFMKAGKIDDMLRQIKANDLPQVNLPVTP